VVLVFPVERMNTITANTPLKHWKNHPVRSSSTRHGSGAPVAADHP
jgi:hypothetical protein